MKADVERVANVNRGLRQNGALMLATWAKSIGETLCSDQKGKHEKE